MASALYRGMVAHRRFKPKSHFLKYRVFQMALDLDELDELDHRLRFFSANKPNVFSIYDVDFGSGGLPLKKFVKKLIDKAGLSTKIDKVVLQCTPRILGFSFNPISIFYCYDNTSRLAALIYDVHNTFGQRHSYLGAVSRADFPVRQFCDKTFHVSPFMSLEMSYAFLVMPPDERVVTVVRGVDGSGSPIIHASFTGERRPLNDRELVRTLLEYKLMTLGVVIAIHLEAFKLILKGLRLRPSPPLPAVPFTVVSEGSGRS